LWEFTPGVCRLDGRRQPVRSASADGVASLAPFTLTPFTLTLADLGVAMLDAPSSIPPRRELVPPQAHQST
jgi:hypothetical protein